MAVVRYVFGRMGSTLGTYIVDLSPQRDHDFMIRLGKNFLYVLGTGIGAFR